MKKQNKKADNSLLSHIQAREWGNFDNKGMFLLIRSMQVKGFRKMQKNAPRKMITEDIVLHYRKDEQLKVYFLGSSFTAEILELYLNNPHLICEYIEKSYVSLEGAKKKIKEAKKKILENKVSELITTTKNILEHFFEISYWKYYISAISRNIYDKNKKNREFKNVFTKINIWKNDEEFYGFEADVLIEIAYFLALKRGLNVEGWEIVKYLHIDEFVDFLEEKIPSQEVVNLIRKREEVGYISLNLEHGDYENILLCNSTQEAQEIIKYVEEIFQKENQVNIKENTLYGTSVAKSEKIIKGECVIIKNYQELNSESDLDGKILVTTMSTPKYLPYIKNVKAIVTDTGGVMCHAAIISREYDIPCIVGTNVATEFLKNGDMVEIDLGKGIIRKIK